MKNSWITSDNPEDVVDLFCEAYAKHYGNRYLPLSNREHVELMQMLMKAVVGYAFARGWELDGIKNGFELLWEEAKEIFETTGTH